MNKLFKGVFLTLAIAQNSFSNGFVNEAASCLGWPHLAPNFQDKIDEESEGDVQNTQTRNRNEYFKNRQNPALYPILTLLSAASLVYGASLVSHDGIENFFDGPEAWPNPQDNDQLSAICFWAGLSGGLYSIYKTIAGIFHNNNLFNKHAQFKVPFYGENFPDDQHGKHTRGLALMRDGSYVTTWRYMDTAGQLFRSPDYRYINLDDENDRHLIRCGALTRFRPAQKRDYADETIAWNGNNDPRNMSIKDINEIMQILANKNEETQTDFSMNEVRSRRTSSGSSSSSERALMASPLQ